ncbi:MAG: C39 family peptidase, partial [Chloroflexota bacterium]
MRALRLSVLATLLIATGCATPYVAPRTSATAIPVPPVTVSPAVVASSSAGAAHAPSAPRATVIAPAPTPAARPLPTSAPVAPSAPRVLLQPMTHEYETWNNCAPVTAEMVLSFFGIRRTQAQIAPILRPNPENFSVRLDQIGTFLAGYGLQSHPLVGGTLELLRQFASNGIPVVTEDQLSLQEDYGHFRVVRGYDDAAGVLILGDSYYGPENRLPYSLYSELWKRHDYAFMPVYQPAQAATVRAILGARYGPAANDAAATATAR